MEHRGVHGTAGIGAGGDTGNGSGSGAGRFGGAGWVAVVAAGCAVAVLATGPSWALRRPEPRPAVEVVAPGAPQASTLPAPAETSTPPAVAGASTLPVVVAAPSRSDLEVVRLDPDPAPPGGSTTVHAFVANRGPDTTASPFTVVVTLPKGVSAEGPYFPQDCQVVARGRQVRCAFGAGLPPLESATALVPLRLSPDLQLGPLPGGSVAVHSADDRDESNNRQPFDVRVVEPTAGS
ncbi:hypothetical protein [Streptomyces sp. 1331.2]|uniref:hypothetical protein n=1 Tax=Streptomyces sp. 1331.2 TaxID=1938835 RepID=UPI000BC42D8C|nr:hypothetical protein [Streptomyces sp. 1331.2]SOB80643.1 hypothetical protein SAMN06272789_1050 [Streptomyces sp. 1331.2]